MTRRRRRTSRAHCPCGSGLNYGRCCAPFHRGEKVPQSPPQLVRTRYSAYARELVDYIIKTTDPDGEAWQEPLEQWRREIRRFAQKTDFSGVEIVDANQVDERATVIFLARLRRGGQDVSFSEKSRFVYQDGRWLYSAGEPQ